MVNSHLPDSLRSRTAWRSLSQSQSMPGRPDIHSSFLHSEVFGGSAPADAVTHPPHRSQR